MKPHWSLFIKVSDYGGQRLAVAWIDELCGSNGPHWNCSEAMELALVTAAKLPRSSSPCCGGYNI